jgi:hypothetical protein
LELEYRARPDRNRSWRPTLLARRPERHQSCPLSLYYQFPRRQACGSTARVVGQSYRRSADRSRRTGMRWLYWVLPWCLRTFVKEEKRQRVKKEKWEVSIIDKKKQRKAGRRQERTQSSFLKEGTNRKKAENRMKRASKAKGRDRIRLREQERRHGMTHLTSEGREDSGLHDGE